MRCFARKNGQSRVQKRVKNNLTDLPFERILTGDINPHRQTHCRFFADKKRKKNVQPGEFTEAFSDKRDRESSSPKADIANERVLMY